MLRSILYFILKLMARAMLIKHRPKIVAITGSVGKTTTKDLIFSVLSSQFFVWRSSGNYNNQIGLPLTILGSESGRKNLLLWLKVIGNFFRYYFSKRYPEILILEMAADRPGDIEYLTHLAPPDVAVLTRIGEAHMEYFGDVESIQKEKSVLIKALTRRGVAVLNFDDPRVMATKGLCVGRTVTYGFGQGAEVQARNLSLFQNTVKPVFDPETDLGSRFEIVFKNHAKLLSAPGTLGMPRVYAMLAAYAVGRAAGISSEDIVEVLPTAPLTAGRLRPLSGIKNTIVIDDSYNSSPQACTEALRVLTTVHGRRRIAVLGDMLELGAATEVAHRKIGRLIRDLRPDLLLTVGARAKFIASEARALGFATTKILEFDTAEEAALPLQGKMREGDVVLVKGSQGVRMEKIVLEIMAEPERVGELLVRQSRYWRKR
jgi:UDP-N-acetylmuramoyl-tripeptide--D-alanyl-D-alanine ligase